MHRVFAIGIALFVIVTFLLHPVFAAKKFVPKPGATVSRSSGGTSRIPSVVRYRADKQAILLSFSNFTGIESASYSFTYSTNGRSQGAGGTITANNNPTSQRELAFGTCSTSVCTYHRGLKDAKLTIALKYTNGKAATKIYRIKTYQ